MNETITVTPAECAACLRICIAARRPAFIWGPPGIGKSAVVGQTVHGLYAARHGYTYDGSSVYDDAGHVVRASRLAYLRDLRLGQLGDVDLRGLPDFDGPPSADRRTRWATPVFWPTDGEGVIFFDELNRALVSVQNAAMQITLDWQLGEYELPEGWLCLAAGNREADGGGVIRLTAAQSERFVHLELVPDLHEWCLWAQQHQIEPAVVAFLRSRPDLLLQFDPKARVSPNPRAWEFASRLLAQRPSNDISLALLAGTVGRGAAVEFLTYVRDTYALVNIDAVLLDPQHATVPTDLDALYAVSAGLAARATGENFDHVLTYVARLPREYGVYAVKDSLTRTPALASSPAFVGWAVKNQDLL